MSDCKTSGHKVPSGKRPRYPSLNLPTAHLKLVSESGQLKVMCRLRRKYVVLTPEEYVRQNFIGWLIDHLGYPASLMANEIGIEVNNTRKRCDTVVFGLDRVPLIIIEYKAPAVRITQNVFDQIVRYNISIRARYLIVSNGFDHYCCEIDYDSGGYCFLKQIPYYRDLQNISSK